MTKREFLKLALAHPELAEYAQAQLDELDVTNAKRRSTKSKSQVANEALLPSVKEAITNGHKIASEIAAYLGISTQKASALAKMLVERVEARSYDLKVKGKGSVKAYELVAEAEDEPEAEDESEAEDEPEAEDESEG